MGSDSKIKLNQDDWDVIFSTGKKIMLGNTEVQVHRLTLEQMYSVLKVFASGGVLGQLNLDKPLADPSNVAVFLTVFDDILSELTGVEKEDLRKLPIDLAIELLTAAVAVDEGFLKNLLTLLETMESVGLTTAKKTSVVSGESSQS